MKMHTACVSFIAMLLISIRSVDATQQVYKDVYTGALYDDRTGPRLEYDRMGPRLEPLQRVSAPEVYPEQQRQTPYMAAPQPQQATMEIPYMAAPGQMQYMAAPQPQQAARQIPYMAPSGQIAYMPAPQSLLDTNAAGAGLALAKDVEEAKKKADELRNQMKVLKAQLKAQQQQQRNWESIAKHEREEVQRERKALEKSTEKVDKLTNDAASSEAKLKESQVKEALTEAKLKDATEKITDISKEEHRLRGSRDQAVKAATWYKEHAKKTQEAEKTAEGQRTRLEKELAAAKSTQESLEHRMSTSMEEVKQQLKETQKLLRAAEAKAHAADERARTVDANAKIAVDAAEDKVRDLQVSSDHNQKIMAAEVKLAKADAHRRVQKAQNVLEHYAAKVAKQAASYMASEGAQ